MRYDSTLKTSSCYSLSHKTHRQVLFLKESVRSTINITPLSSNLQLRRIRKQKGEASANTHANPSLLHFYYYSLSLQPSLCLTLYTLFMSCSAFDIECLRLFSISYLMLFPVLIFLTVFSLYLHLSCALSASLLTGGFSTHRASCECGGVVYKNF